MTIDYYKWNNLDTDSESELDPDSKTGMALNSPQPEGNIKNRASVPQSRGEQISKAPGALIATALDDHETDPRYIREHPRETFRQLHHFWFSAITNFQEHPMIRKQTLDQAGSTLDLLMRTTEQLFSKGSSVAGSLMIRVMFAAKASRFDISLADISVWHGPGSSDHGMTWEKCRITGLLIILLACPPNASIVSNAYDFFGGAAQPLQIIQELNDLRDARTIRAGKLTSSFKKARNAIRSNGQNTITVLGVQLLDMAHLTVDPREAHNYYFNGKYITFTHAFSVAISKEGIRVFQSSHIDYDMESYSFPQYINRVGARLWSWEEAEEFLRNFEIIETPSSHWSPRLNAAFTACFDYDMNEQIAAATFKHQKKSVAPDYVPFVRILEIPGVTADNFSKFKWEWKTHHADLLTLANLAD